MAVHIGRILILLASLYQACDCISFSQVAQAQISPDLSLPRNSVVTSQGNLFTITGGFRVGNNLFHSFRDFSIATGNTAFFNNALDIQNILTRITGSSISNIDGLLKANGSANLFLINPNGIIFGKNARLDIGGSFIASTANSIKFSDNSEFSAVNPQAFPLTISTPLGLQMGTKPPPITVNGNGDGIRTTSNLIDTTVGLRVNPAQTLALVGGDIAIAGGTLKTAGGNIELASLGASALVGLNFTNKGVSLNADNISAWQDIRLSNKASVDASGIGAGNIFVRARNISVTGDSQIQTSTLGNGNGGILFLKAVDNVELLGTSILNPLTAGGLQAKVKPGATGNGADLTVEATRISLQGVQVATDILGTGGNGGDLTLKATESIEAVNSFISTSIRSSSSGRAGNLSITTPRFSLLYTNISSDVQGTGKGGLISVKASDRIEAIGVAPDGKAPSGFISSVGKSGEGTGGNIQIETGKLSLQNGAAISSSTFNNGDAGSITVKASDRIEVIGKLPDNNRPSSLAGRVEENSTGQGGSIIVETPNLLIAQGGSISVSDTVGKKGAGNVQITANNLLLDSGSITAETRAGIKGNISLNSSNLQLLNQSQIQANAFGTATGGNITINTQTLVALQNSDITANAQDASGGKVQIDAQSIFGTASRAFVTPQSDIAASSEKGPNFAGVVQINITDVDPSKGVQRESTQTIDSSKLIVQRCQSDTSQSKFIVAGRGGLPPSPTDSLTTNRDYEIIGANPLNTPNLPVANAQVEESKPEIVEANNWAIAPNGGITLMASSPSATLSSLANTAQRCRN